MTSSGPGAFSKHLLTAGRRNPISQAPLSNAGRLISVFWSMASGKIAGTIRKSGGRFVRPESQFRNWITPDGSPGPSGRGGFAAEPGRYHLYVSLACPWAHRTLIFRAFKGLEELHSYYRRDPFMGPEGWTFNDGPGVIPDTR